MVVVIHPDDDAAFTAACTAAGPAGATRITACPGGTSRQASVSRGLEALAAAGLPEGTIVLIHDAARPFAPEAVILRAVLAAQRHGAAIPVLPVPDTLAALDEAGQLAGNPIATPSGWCKRRRPSASAWFWLPIALPPLPT